MPTSKDESKNGQAPKDSRLRFRLQQGSLLERTVTALKSEGRDKERHRLETAVCAFWAPYAYQDSDDLQRVALESILELSDQILEIALLANLPVDQLDLMGLKTRAISLKQQQKKPVTANSENTPAVKQATPTQATVAAKTTTRTTKPPATTRESLFDD